MYSSNTSTTSSQISCHYYFLPFGLTFRKVRHETQKWKSQFLTSTRTHAAMAACSSFSHENLYELFCMKISLHICKGHLSGLKSKKSDCCSMCEFRKEKKNPQNDNSFIPDIVYVLCKIHPVLYGSTHFTTYILQRYMNP